MRSFSYYEPSKIEEAVNLLGQLEGEVKLLAGGTDLLIQMKRRLITPQAVIALHKIPSLQYLEETGQGLSIGTLTKIRELEFSPLLREKADVLVQAATKLGSRQIRNLATIGGNICNAAPSAEMAAPLLVLNAQVHLQGPDGKRTIPIASFFSGPRQTWLRPNEIVLGFTVDKYSHATRAAYLRYTRRKAMDIAVVSVAVRLDMAADGITVESARVGLGAVAPTPVTVREAEDLLTGKELTAQVIAEAGKVTSKAARPITDIRAGADYRRHLVNVLTVQALNRLAQVRQRFEGLGGD